MNKDDLKKSLFPLFISSVFAPTNLSDDGPVPPVFNAFMLLPPTISMLFKLLSLALRFKGIGRLIIFFIGVNC